MPKMISRQFGSWKQVLTDWKAYEKIQFHAKVAIYEKGVYLPTEDTKHQVQHKERANDDKRII